MPDAPKDALAAMDTIPDSEISPAAFVFEQRDDPDELNIYEEKYQCAYGLDRSK